MTLSEGQVVVRFGLASIAIGFLLQAVERLTHVEPGVNWEAIYVTGTMPGIVMGRQERGLRAVLEGGEVGMGVGAVDGAVRGLVMYVTETTYRKEVSLSGAIGITAGTLAIVGTICGCIGASLVVVFTRLSHVWGRRR